MEDADDEWEMPQGDSTHPKNRDNNISMHDKSEHGQILKMLSEIKHQMTILANENKAIKDEVASIKRKREIVNTVTPNASVNKSTNNKTVAKVNNNNKRQMVSRSDQESSDENLSDIDARLKKSDQQFEALDAKLGTLTRLITTQFQTTDNEQDHDGDMILEDKEQDLLDI